MRRVGLSVVLGVCAAAIGIAAQGQPPPQPPPAPGQLAPQYFKNIKVLTRVPADQLRTQMEYFTASLGVQCNFCHVQGQFDSDENPRKDRARKMMKMVDRFNEDPANDVTVTCATCHHGRVPPERTPSLAVVMTQVEAEAAAAARAARAGGPGGPGRGAPGSGGPGGQGRGGRGTVPPAPAPTESVDQVIEKYVQALGGAAALAAAKTRTLAGTQTTRDLQTQPIKVQEKASGEYRIDVASTPNPAVRVWSPSGAWMSGQGPNPRDLEGVQAAQVSRPTDFGLALGLKKAFSGLTVRRYDTVDGKPAVVLEGRRGDVINETLFFDRESGLLLRRAVQTRTAYGPLAEQVDYSDYRESGGIKVPFQIKYTTWNQVTTEKFTDAQVNALVDDAIFSKK